MENFSQLANASFGDACTGKTGKRAQPAKTVTGKIDE